jgi:hypothetical protein
MVNKDQEYAAVWRKAKTRDVLAEVDAERTAQDARWGEQNHADGTGDTDTFHGIEYGRWARIAKHACQTAPSNGGDRWSLILLEEVFEALVESDQVKLRAELVQVAAVAVNWIEAIDRGGPSASAPGF